MMNSAAKEAAMLRPGAVEDVQAMVRQHERVLPRGGGTKSALSTPRSGEVAIDMTALDGVVAYEPGEFTVTAMAGSRVAGIEALLRQNGQYLPFDPLFVERGATLGGTVASGLNGPGRYRYGGLRDFLIGIRFVDGQGQLVRSGGKVVKNAAGFDISKLMVGSLGRLGILTELSFKVFPEPPAAATIRVDCPDLNMALEHIYRLYGSQLDLDALDLDCTAERPTLWLRLAGLPDALPVRTERLAALVGGKQVAQAEASGVWAAVREMAWAPRDCVLVKVPVTPARIPRLDAVVAGLQRRYSAGGQVAWLALPGPVGPLDDLLAEQGLAGLVVQGMPERLRLGTWPGEPFARRVKAALDSTGRFGEA